ncbi:serine/arginine repetitive matrix protein 1-like [Schistocerca serialis cubense]|uniref:serine/arginine repetitive matrix protein 1-like n=1 Tax=Schistocerca serialis cubense TaxID=2023355 RepID=UPI00214F4B6D|nr:serine/arginine repetitive matrix protein 1-like [Schistocerca serialis cubense]
MNLPPPPPPPACRPQRHRQPPPETPDSHTRQPPRQDQLPAPATGCGAPPSADSRTVSGSQQVRPPACRLIRRLLITEPCCRAALKKKSRAPEAAPGSAVLCRQLGRRCRRPGGRAAPLTRRRLGARNEPAANYTPAPLAGLAARLRGQARHCVLARSSPATYTRPRRRSSREPPHGRVFTSTHTSQQQTPLA